MKNMETDYKEAGEKSLASDLISTNIIIMAFV